MNPELNRHARLRLPLKASGSGSFRFRGAYCQKISALESTIGLISIWSKPRATDQNQRPTLGIIRPHLISRFRIAPDPTPWTDAQLAMLRQQHFFAEPPEEELEKIPFKFYYEFRCPEETCNGHMLMCTDWEMGQSYRKWRMNYGDGWEEKFRLKYETWMLGRDIHFYVGTVASHPNRWVIIGLFYPPLEADPAQGSLFA